MKQKYIPHPWPERTKEEIKIANKKNYDKYRKSEKARKKIPIWVRRHRDKIKLNPEKHAKLKLELNLRNRIRSVMKTKYEIKKSRIGPGSKLFGCSGRELKAHIQNQFAKGMNWQNYGTWHVDHIKPVKKFDLRIIDVEILNTHGGSIRFYVAKKKIKI